MTGLICVAALTTGCARGARTPDDAYQRFAAAVNAQNATGLFDSLDQQTRWSWMTVQRCHREAYDILLSAFPEGTERARQLARFEPGATSESARALFVRQIDPSIWTRLAAGGLPDGAPVNATDTEGQVALPAGARLVFRKGDDKRWGFSGLADDAEQIKRRAIADLDMLRTSAADYERAAARSGK